MAWTTNHPLFRSLTDAEEAEFRIAGADLFHSGQPYNPLWHPVCREAYQAAADAAAREEVEGYARDVLSLVGKPNEALDRELEAEERYSPPLIDMLCSNYIVWKKE
jgi:hypothetical protein